MHSKSKYCLVAPVCEDWDMRNATKQVYNKIPLLSKGLLRTRGERNFTQWGSKCMTGLIF